MIGKRRATWAALLLPLLLALLATGLRVADGGESLSETTELQQSVEGDLDFWPLDYFAGSAELPRPAGSLLSRVSGRPVSSPAGLLSPSGFSPRAPPFSVS